MMTVETRVLKEWPCVYKINQVKCQENYKNCRFGDMDGQTKLNPVDDLITGEKIGYKKMLSYVLNSGSRQVKGGWMMHEYSIDGASLNGLTSTHSTNSVLCRIILDNDKYTKIKESVKKGKSPEAKRLKIMEALKLSWARESKMLNKKICRRVS